MAEQVKLPTLKRLGGREPARAQRRIIHCRVLTSGSHVVANFEMDQSLA